MYQIPISLERSTRDVRQVSWMIWAVHTAINTPVLFPGLKPLLFSVNVVIKRSKHAPVRN